MIKIDTEYTDCRPIFHFYTTFPQWCSHFTVFEWWNCSSAPFPKDEVRGVTVTKTGSCAIVVSAKSERKRGISVQNTNQLAGNHTFIFLLTLISLQGKGLHSRVTISLSLSSRALLSETMPSLCLKQIISAVLCAITVAYPNCLPATANNCSHVRSGPRLQRSQG